MKITKFAVSTAVTAFFAWLIYYFALPAINLSSPGFYWYLIILGVIFSLCTNIFDTVECESYASSITSWSITAMIVVILIFGSWFSSSMFNASTYQKRLDVETSTFDKEIPIVDWNTVPQIDRDSSSILGNRKMGTLTNEISQYNVQNNYTQINYDGKPVRVSPLGYASFLKYWNNKHEGIPGYIVVNGVTKEADFVRLEKGIKYSPSACFSKDLKRYLRNNFVTTLFSDFSFEIDDEGKPYYVVPTFKYSGLGGAKIPTGCILVDPVTGEFEVYDMNNIPTWIDHSIDEDIVVNMIDSWGKFQNGYWNTIFGQKNVKVSTDGYNYITINDDVYLYTGITSVVQDESNIGFILVNMRTGFAKYFDMPSAEEYSAMDSAKGQVQHLNYTSTFPILINANGVPTYFLSLKDAAGLVKMYAFVSVENIQVLSVSEASLGVERGINEYLKIVNNDPTNISSQEKNLINMSITISEINTTTIEGNSYYYIISSDGELFIANINTGLKCLPILKVGDIINVSCLKSGNYYDVTSVSK